VKREEGVVEVKTEAQVTEEPVEKEKEYDPLVESFYNEVRFF
jgi:hypothetical protein